MKSVIVVENSTNELIKESVNTASTGRKDYRMSGIFTEFGIKNRNERIYTAEGFLPALNEFNEKIAENGGVYGELDHPDVFDISMAKATHLVESALYVPEKNRVEGNIRIIPSVYGNQVRDMIDSNCPIFVSSRAAGVTESNGRVLIKKLFTYDIVADPGFASAKMTCINESLGYKSNESANFRIYEISDEIKMNEFFEMNNNDEQTEAQLVKYSEYLKDELAKTQVKLNESISRGNMDRAELNKVIAYYEELQLANEKMTKYLTHIHETVSVVIDMNKKLVKENKDLSTKVDNVQTYTEFVEGKLNEQIEISNHAFDKLDQSVAYSEVLKSFIESNIDKTNSLESVLEKNTLYLQHLGDASDENFTEISEELKANASYIEYLGENLNKSVVYQGAIVEHLNGNILLEGAKEQLPNPEAFGFKLVESADKECETEETEEVTDDEAKAEEVADAIIEALEIEDTHVEDELTSDQIEEDEEIEFEDVEADADVDNIVDTINVDEPIEDTIEDTIEDMIEEPVGEPIVDDIEDSSIADIMRDFADLASDLAELVNDELELSKSTEMDTDLVDTDLVDTDLDVVPTEEPVEGDLENEFVSDEETEEYNTGLEKLNVFSESKSISESISELIEVAKKQKVTNTNECRFLHFLNKKQIENFNSLSQEDQETAKLYINEKSYYSTADVLRLIEESLSIKGETHEERVMRLMPEDLSDKWESLTESAKKSVIAQSSLIPNLVSESQIENFWHTRTFVKEEPVSKTIISEEKAFFENKLSDDDFNNIMKRFKGLNS